jgi:hypothetical protein
MLLQYGIFNRVATLRSVAAASAFHNDMCSENASNMSDSRVSSIGASYGLFSGNASDARRRIQSYQSRYCSNTSSSADSKDLTQEERSYVSPELVNAFTECKKLQEKGVYVQPTVNFGRFATFAIRQTYGGTVNFEGVWATPPSAWKCQGRNAAGQVISVDQGTSLPLSNSLLTVTCERDGDEVTVGGAKILEAPQSQLAIHTQTENLVLAFAQTSARNELTSLRDDIARAIPTGMIAPFATSCPSGWQEYTPASGRFLLGQNNAHPIGQTNNDGETRKLAVANLPVHQHQTVEAGDPTHSYMGYGPTQWARNGVNWVAGYGTSSQTAPAGGDQAFSIMPPFVSVTYCQKQ